MQPLRGGMDFRQLGADAILGLALEKESIPDAHQPLGEPSESLLAQQEGADAGDAAPQNDEPFGAQSELQLRLGTAASQQLQPLEAAPNGNGRLPQSTQELDEELLAMPLDVPSHTASQGPSTTTRSGPSATALPHSTMDTEALDADLLAMPLSIPPPQSETQGEPDLNPSMQQHDDSMGRVDGSHPSPSLARSRVVMGTEELDADLLAMPLSIPPPSEPQDDVGDMADEPPSFTGAGADGDEQEPSQQGQEHEYGAAATLFNAQPTMDTEALDADLLAMPLSIPPASEGQTEAQELVSAPAPSVQHPPPSSMDTAALDEDLANMPLDVPPPSQTGTAGTSAAGAGAGSSALPVTGRTGGVVSASVEGPLAAGPAEGGPPVPQWGGGFDEDDNEPMPFDDADYEDYLAAQAQEHEQDLGHQQNQLMPDEEEWGAQGQAAGMGTRSTREGAVVGGSGAGAAATGRTSQATVQQQQQQEREAKRARVEGGAVGAGGGAVGGRRPTMEELFGSDDEGDQRQEQRQEQQQQQQRGPMQFVVEEEPEWDPDAWLDALPGGRPRYHPPQRLASNVDVGAGGCILSVTNASGERVYCRWVRMRGCGCRCGYCSWVEGKASTGRATDGGVVGEADGSVGQGWGSSMSSGGKVAARRRGGVR